MTLHRFFTFGLFVTSLLFADPACGNQKNKGAGAVFSIISLNSLPYENLYYRSGKKFTEIELQRNKRSSHYTIPDTGFLELYAEHKDSEQRYQLVGKTRLIKGTRKILYFIRASRSTKEGALPITLYGVDDSRAVFPDSSFRFINFMNIPLRIEFDSKKFVAKPGRLAVRKVNFTEAGSFAPFIVRDMNARVLGGTRLFGHAAGREMVLIFPPKRGKKRLDIRYYSD